LVVATAAHTRLSLTDRIPSTKAERKRDRKSNNQIHPQATLASEKRMQLGPTSSNGTFRRKYVPTIFDFNQGNRILDTVGAAVRFLYSF
jgi:hypothetical protein